MTFTQTFAGGEPSAGYIRVILSIYSPSTVKQQRILASAQNQYGRQVC